MRLELARDAFDAMTPCELAWLFWAERRRRHIQLRYVAWAVSMIMAPHIGGSGASSIDPGRLFYAVTGGDLDEDEAVN